VDSFLPTAQAGREIKKIKSGLQGLGIELERLPAVNKESFLNSLIDRF
jgi:hypothetical protein